MCYGKLSELTWLTGEMSDFIFLKLHALTESGHNLLEATTGLIKIIRADVLHTKPAIIVDNQVVLESFVLYARPGS